MVSLCLRVEFLIPQHRLRQVSRNSHPRRCLCLRSAEDSLAFLSSLPHKPCVCLEPVSLGPDLFSLSFRGCLIPSSGTWDMPYIPGTEDAGREQATAAAPLLRACLSCLGMSHAWPREVPLLLAFWSEEQLPDWGQLKPVSLRGTDK